MGLRWGLLNALLSIPYTYCVCPVAQEPNSGTLQFNSWEQGYKDYIDQKYDLYKNADYDFYKVLAAHDETKKIKEELLPMMNERSKVIEQAYN